jgi:hypothetical protein
VIPLYDASGYIVQPEEGELHRRTPSSYKTPGEVLDWHVWSVNVDEPKSVLTRSLRLLWDATDILLSK